MTEIYLIRHTHAEGNMYRLMQGHWDGCVTPLGYKEIDALAERFRDEHIDAVYSSDLSRAMLTAEAVTRGKGLKIIPDRRFREIDLGPWEAQFFGNISYKEPKAANDFLTDPAGWKIPGAETYADVIGRSLSAMTELAEKHSGQRIAIVSHGVTIRCLLAGALGLSLAPGELLPIVKNTSITKLIYRDGAYKAEVIGDAAHISGLTSGDWVTSDGLRDEVFDPSEAPSFYTAVYKDAWSAAHNGSLHGFDAAHCLQAAQAHHRAHPGAVRKLYHPCGDWVGLIDCDTEHHACDSAGWISLLYLTPEYRGRGYGVQVLARAIVLYKALAREKLQLTVSAANRTAIGFYEKNGFRIMNSEPGASGSLYLMERIGI